MSWLYRYVLGFGREGRSVRSLQELVEIADYAEGSKKEQHRCCGRSEVVVVGCDQVMQLQ
jgi:hypothetical protein